MRSAVTLFALIGPLAACSVGPEYKRPDLDVPNGFRDQAEAPSEKSLADLTWWEVYQDKALQRLLTIALEENRNIKIAASRVTEARAQAGVSRLAQYPQLEALFSGQRGRILQGAEHVTGAILTTEVQTSYEVDLWRRLANLSEAARANLLATEYARDAVKVSLVSDVATGYFDLLSLDQQYRIAQRTVETRQRFFDLTQKKFRRGASSGLDVNRAEASLATARATLPALQLQISQTENQLQILIGRNPGPIVREQLDLPAVPIPPEVPAGLPSSLLERRPDLRQAESVLVGETANVRAAKAALFPTISLTGSFGVESFELSNLIRNESKIWSIGFGLLQPLIDAQRNRYQVEAAQARAEQAILHYQDTVAQAFREVSDALVAQRDYAEILNAQEQQVNALREASRRVLRRYEVGYSSYFEVIDANGALFTAELLQVQAYRNKLVSLVQLYKALGGGWDNAASPPHSD